MDLTGLGRIGEPDANLTVMAPDGGPHRIADRGGNAEAGWPEASSADVLRGSRSAIGRPDFDRAGLDTTTKPRTAKPAFTTTAGLVLFALGVAAAVGLAYLTGLTVRFFAAGQTITAALTFAAATATMWAIWASITHGWHRLWPGT
jgi:hypothetical protein